MSRFAVVPARALDDPRMSPAALRVLLEFGRHTDRHGWCRPHADTIAERLGVGRTAVANQVRLLKEWGYLERGKRVGIRGYEWRVVFDGVDDPPQVSRDVTANGSGVTSGDDSQVSRLEMTPHSERPSMNEVTTSSHAAADAAACEAPLRTGPYWDDNPTLRALLDELEMPADQFDADFCAELDRATEGTGVYWDVELRRYVMWLRSRPPSRRHKNLRRGFGTWVQTAIGRDDWRRRNATRRR